MTNRKENISYTFTVEGDTEKWYLDWLEKQINACSDAAYKVSIASKKEPNPMSYAKTVNRMTKPKVIHLCDVESNEPDEVKRFQAVLSELNEAKKEKKIQYTLGYSNFTFELWMIITSVTEIKNYLTSELQNIDEQSELNAYVRSMRNACNKFLSKCPDKKEFRCYACQPGNIDNWIFTSAIGELRGVFGVMIGQIAKAYGLDVEDDLAQIIPE